MHGLGVSKFGVQIYYFFTLRDLDVGACIFKEYMPIETFNISFESTQHKQQYGTKITSTEIRGES